MFKRLLVMPGFGPAAEVLLFRQKDPKPCWPWRGPLPPQGQALRVPCAVRRHRRRANSRSLPCAMSKGSNSARLFLRCRLHCSASPQASYRILVLLGLRGKFCNHVYLLTAGLNSKTQALGVRCSCWVLTGVNENACWRRPGKSHVGVGELEEGEV